MINRDEASSAGRDRCVYGSRPGVKHRQSRSCFEIAGIGGNVIVDGVKKAISELKRNGVEALGLMPGSLSIAEMITSKGVC